jgi:bifunctional DNA-binding transcriptional regulator/antitoxin component of YhaV-PrlF toxin-antitoxin module
MRLIKTSNITNARNVLVQIPSFLIAEWGLTVGDFLEVSTDEEKSKLVIKPRKAVQAGARPTRNSRGLA